MAATDTIPLVDPDGIDAYVAGKKTDFDTNAAAKTSAFDSNAAAKKADFDTNAAAKKNLVTAEGNTQEARLQTYVNQQLDPSIPSSLAEAVQEGLEGIATASAGITSTGTAQAALVVAAGEGAVADVGEALTAAQTAIADNVAAVAEDATDAQAILEGGEHSSLGTIAPEASVEGLATVVAADRVVAEESALLAIAGIRRDWNDPAQFAAYRDAAPSTPARANVDKVFQGYVALGFLANPLGLAAAYVDRLDRAFVTGGQTLWRGYINDAGGTQIASFSTAANPEALPYIVLTHESGTQIAAVINWGALAVGSSAQTYGAGILVGEEVMRGKELPQRQSERITANSAAILALGSGGGGEEGPPLVSVGHYPRPTPGLFAATNPSGVPATLAAPSTYPSALLHGYGWALASARSLDGLTFTNATGQTVLIRRRSPGPDGLFYMGGWNASGNYPIPDAVGQQVANKFFGRMFWVVTTAGNGFAVGDRLVCRGLAVGTNTVIVAADADEYYNWDRVPAGLATRGIGRKIFYRGAFNAGSDNLGTVTSGLANLGDGDYLEVSGAGSVAVAGYGTVALAVGDRLVRVGGAWEPERCAPVTTLASGGSVTLADTAGGVEVRRADGSATGVFVGMAGSMQTSLTAYTEAVGDKRMLRIVDEADGQVDLVPEMDAVFPGASVTSLRVANDASYIDLGITADAGAFEARYLPANRVFRVRSNGVVAAGDSIAAHLHNGLEDVMPGRTPVLMGLASANAASITENWRYHAEVSPDPDLGGRILLAVLDWDLADKTSDFGIFETKHFEALAQFDRALVMGHLTTRSVTWNGSALVLSGTRDAEDFALIRAMQQAFGRRHLDPLEIALDAVAGVYDPQFPGAADQVAAVTAAGGLIYPFGWYKLKNQALSSLITFSAIESYRGKHQGYWTTGAMPTGGVSGDHYVVATAGSGDPSSEVGDLLLNNGGTWVYLGLDSTHPGTSMQAALAEAVDDRLTELGW